MSDKLIEEWEWNDHINDRGDVDTGIISMLRQTFEEMGESYEQIIDMPF